ncbi:MAG: hypothetical protein ACYC8W_10040 [Candidatus Tyrphobacter sp.]
MLNRIDDTIAFEELGAAQIEAIVTIHVDALAARLGARDAKLRLTDDAKAFLAQEAMAAGSGARFVQRIVSRHVSTPLSTALLKGELVAGGTADVTRSNGALVVRA